ncbi:hypothetical protein D0Y65_015707 [Glycine soja]|uniref:Uncharacterized protein n=1 Tax=Glycine soja TaxID=3848 RepID=A0A445KE23_GLYSO|nr:hypothetical protein D0Y65_015707 [Glycine soja]
MTTGDPPQQKTSQGNEKKKEDENITQGDPPQRERSQKIGIKKKFKKMTQAFFLSLDVEVEYGDARQSSNRLARVLKNGRIEEYPILVHPGQIAKAIGLLPRNRNLLKMLGSYDDKCFKNDAIFCCRKGR